MSLRFTGRSDAAVARNTGPFLEFPARPVSYESWYTPAFTLQPGGLIRVPAGPGLGVTYAPEVWPDGRRL